MFKVGTMLKAREVRLSRKKPPYHPALIPGTIFAKAPMNQVSWELFRRPKRRWQLENFGNHKTGVGILRRLDGAPKT